MTTPAGPIPTSPSTPSVPAVKRKPGPASKTGRPQVALPKRPLVVVEADNDQDEEEPLPQGWRIRNRGSGGQTFISPDGREFLVSLPSCNEYAENIPVETNFFLTGKRGSLGLLDNRGCSEPIQEFARPLTPHWLAGPAHPE